MREEDNGYSWYIQNGTLSSTIKDATIKNIYKERERCWERKCCDTGGRVVEVGSEGVEEFPASDVALEWQRATGNGASTATLLRGTSLARSPFTAHHSLPWNHEIAITTAETFLVYIKPFNICQTVDICIGIDLSMFISPCQSSGLFPDIHCPHYLQRSGDADIHFKLRRVTSTVMCTAIHFSKIISRIILEKDLIRGSNAMCSTKGDRRSPWQRSCC